MQSCSTAIESVWSIAVILENCLPNCNRNIQQEYTVIVKFTPKYHAEIAGEGVECSWGFAKKICQRMPLKLKRDFGDFTKIVRDCLLKVTLG
jgi:hypothetical protein